MLRCLLTACVLLLSSMSLADDPRRQVSVSYSAAGTNSEQTSLDVYAPATGEDLPIVIWIHGGAWRIGDKARVERKPEFFNSHGFVMISINYRLHPATDYAGQAADVAQAIRWVHDHAIEFGGSPGQKFLMGHSAGAHLAALVATDERYLRAAGLDLSTLSGVILLDGAGYDIPRQIELAPLPRLKETYRTVFTDDLQKQRDASPINHVAPDKGIPPFLILYVATRRDGRVQSKGLASALSDANVPSRSVAAQNKTHATINRGIGVEGDEPSRLVLAFLQERTAPVAD
jgi:acetyl esterase/lipase